MAVRVAGGGAGEEGEVMARKSDNLTPRQKLVLKMIRQRPGYRPRSDHYRDKRSIVGLVKRKLVQWSAEHGGYVAIEEGGLLPPVQTKMSWHPEANARKELQEYAP